MIGVYLFLLPPDPQSKSRIVTPRAAARIAIFGVLAVVLSRFSSSGSGLPGDLGRRVPGYGSEQPDPARCALAARGPILDGRPRAGLERAGTVVELCRRHRWPPRRGRQRLSEAPRRVREGAARAVKARANDPLTPISVKTNVHEARANYMQEHRSDFPGVKVATTHLRRYEYGALAFHTATSGRSTRRSSSDSGRAMRAVTGWQTGIERAYDTFLRGEPGVAQARFNASNELTSAPQPSQQPKAGYSVRLTMTSGCSGRSRRRSGMASSWPARTVTGRRTEAPSLPWIRATVPSSRSRRTRPRPVRLFAGRIDPRSHAALRSEPGSGAGSTRRSMVPSTAYPARSTFKPVTALAALAEGLISAEEYFQCDAGRVIDDQRFDHWNCYVDEPMTLAIALTQSCDTYFYDVGLMFYEQEKSPARRGPAGWASGARRSRRGPGATGASSRRRLAGADVRRPVDSLDERRPGASSRRTGRSPRHPAADDPLLRPRGQRWPVVDPYLVRERRAAGELP